MKGKKAVAQATSLGKASGGERVRIILVSPEYEINVGAVARAMKNFGFSELSIVSPKCNPLGFDAIMHSKHAREVLEGAKICKTLSVAKKGCKFAIGTTGVLFRHWNKTFRSPVPLRKLRERLRECKEGKIALVFGSEGVGLSEKDVSSCDFLVTIPTSGNYPILNLSHAVAVCLYELSKISVTPYAPADGRVKEELVRAFSLLVGKYAKEMRNPKKAKVAFRRMVGKSMLSDKECTSIIGVLRRALRALAGQ